ncbi:SPFH domain-containing protein [Clostridium sp. CS001]|uniref:SPFH domain-containing protein n=1 Tax=Clostridium sp. CS001 TaxID=2880648 RepID=UPI001CF3ED0E|nr:SPFH domain-containing protein [Clostridium sp. CS001]MCB2289826.1 SPFH domain-containing protein [Clostridium sp. CS001]
MGIFKAVTSSIGGELADQWLETIEPEQMDNSILVSYGTFVRKGDSRGSNKRGTEDVISNGSIIHVPENVYMLLVDGGKIISASDEPGYYQVDNSRSPSIFLQSLEGTEIAGYGNTGRNAIERPGGFKNTLKDSFERFKFGGVTPVKQRVVYINKQEIPNIRFGTKNPVSYTDRVLVPGRVVPCKITSFGTYSIKVGDPLLFYNEVCSKTGKDNLSSSDMAEQYINEFLQAYTTALANLSANFVLVSDITIKTMELGQYMAEVLDKEWLLKRGFYIHSVGIAGIGFDEATDKLLEKYANDSILMDPNARAARMTGSLASGLEAAGSNQGGAMLGFAGMSMGMNAAGALGAMPGQQMQYEQRSAQTTSVASGWACSCGNTMPLDAIFCSKCGSKKPVREDKPQEKGWTCNCGKAVIDGMFCSNCGSKKPEDKKWTCSCGNVTEDLFCSKCGNKKQ